MDNANTNAVFRYLAGLNGAEPITVVPRAAKEARKVAERVLSAALSLDEGTLRAAISGPTLSTSVVAFLVYLATECGARQHQRKAAMAKNASAREFVQNAWRSRATLSESKASFARRHVGIVLKRYQTTITADTIARDWLPREVDELPTWPLPAAAVAWTGRSFIPRK